MEITKIHDPADGLLLHMVFRLSEFNDSSSGLTRVDISSADEYLQAAVIRIPEKHSFRPHVHLERSRRFPDLRAQESWVVMSGSVEVDYYDDSGTLIVSHVLGPGDLTISFRGGHGYRCLSGDATVYEFKSGPYEGQAIDKRFID